MRILPGRIMHRGPTTTINQLGLAATAHQPSVFWPQILEDFGWILGILQEAHLEKPKKIEGFV